MDISVCNDGNPFSTFLSMVEHNCNTIIYRKHSATSSFQSTVTTETL